jgi:hypothetical protein
MKRTLLSAVLCLCASLVSYAQQSPSDVPASKEDVQKYLEVMHSREMTSKVLDAMLKPMHQMMHEQYLKDKDKLPPDFESRMNKQMDDFLKSFPFEEIYQAMVPVYQKHFTKKDIDSFIAFYSAPAGQKLLQEMPAITAESMQTMMPLIQKHIEAMQQRVDQETAQMIKDSKGAAGNKPQTTPN